MKRRSFLAAVAPIVALVAPAVAQNPAAGEAAGGRLVPGASGRLTPAGAGAATDVGASPAKVAKGPTEITAREAMLDNKMNLAVFSGEVDVKSPEYNVNCDKLTIYLKNQKAKAPVVAKPAEPKAIGADDAPAAPAEKEGEKGQGDGKIDKAIAEGNVRILQVKVPVGGGKPEKYFGTGKKAVFENEKQICTLTGWPRVQQSVGNSLAKEIISLEEGCVIVMSPDRIDVRGGRHTTRLIDESALGTTPKAGNR